MRAKAKERSGVDVHVRLPEAAHRALVASAAANRRTITAELIVWVEQAAVQRSGASK